MQTISGQLIDLHQRRIYPAEIAFESNRILSIREVADAPQQYILPGFVDAHVHIESAMLTPAAFARLAVAHGTVATVSDPHEIANVCGVKGVQYMLDNAAQTNFHFFFGAPSCVPATGFETAGATLDAAAVAALLQRPDIWYLSEMMNYPGVLQGDESVLAKIAAARAAGKPVDGHAPGLMGEAAQQYAAAGISTDHECTTLQEAKDKIAAGMKILIREGSAAKNYEALAPLFETNPKSLMFCSDDKHPDDLLLHHINELVKRSLDKGYNLFDVLYAACMAPVLHYKLPVGLLRVNDTADFIVMSEMGRGAVLQTFINGQLVFTRSNTPPPLGGGMGRGRGKVNLPEIKAAHINVFQAQPVKPEQFQLKAPGAHSTLHVIQALDGQLITRAIKQSAVIENGWLQADLEKDVLKLVVLNRYTPDAKPALAFIKGFGIQKGAIASTVAHDCHNIIATGADDASIAAAINAIVKSKGGIAVAKSPAEVEVMPLPIAGLMSDLDGETVGRQYAALDAAAKNLGSTLKAPFMTLSFMALLVIPALKLSDKGLFDGEKFEFVDAVSDTYNR